MKLLEYRGTSGIIKIGFLAWCCLSVAAVSGYLRFLNIYKIFIVEVKKSSKNRFLFQKSPPPLFSRLPPHFSMKRRLVSQINVANFLRCKRFVTALV